MLEESKNIISSGGLNLDSSPDTLAEGEYTFMLNGKLFRKGNSYFGNNYNGSEICINFPSGFLFNGNIPTLDPNIHIVFLVNPNDQSDNKNNSEIGTFNTKTCSYTRNIRDYCLNFQITHPISGEYKESFQCGKTIYFCDNYNPDRYINLENIPYLDSGALDCDTIRLDPIFSYPCTILANVSSNGALESGAYQFAVQYADSNGIGLTDFTDLTNQVDIIRHNSQYLVAGDPPLTPTSKSITLNFSNLDTSFSNFNLAVLKTANQIKTAFKIITLPTSTTNYIYTGTELSTQDLTLDELIQRRTVYLHSKVIRASQGYLLRGDLQAKDTPNLQKYANDIQVQWVTYRANYQNYINSYKNEVTINQMMSLMRDEIYPLSIRWLYNTGDKTCAYPIPGREINKKADGSLFTNVLDQYGQGIIPSQWDTYNVNNTFDCFENINTRWKVYNTGVLSGFTQEYTDYILNGGDPSTYEGCFMYGEMAYWESTDKYPNQPNVWGALANTPIRHHKMPDCSITNIFNNTDGTYLEDPYIEILGLKLDNISIDSTLFPDIVGYEILIGDRTIQKSIIDKGLLFNNMFHDPPNSNDEPEGAITQIPFYYTNWVYNDLSNTSNYGHTDVAQFDSFTGYSPRALFNNVAIGSASEVKLENEFYGNAQYISGLGGGTNLENGFTYIHDARINKGLYNQYIQSQFGSVRREIENIEYLLNNVSQSTALGNFNNIGREGSTIFSTTEAFSANSITDDSHNFHTSFTNFLISSYYYSLKQDIPNLWGKIEDIPYLSSGKCIFDISQTSISCFFPGDTFITKFAIHKRVVDPEEFVAAPLDHILNVYLNGDLGDTVDIRYGIAQFFVESDVNTEYRYNGNTIKEYFSPNLNYGLSNDGDWLSLTNTWYNIDNYYLYNNDYSTINNSNSVCTILDSFDGVQCTKDYYSRVIYSLKDQTEGLSDNWLVYLPNNYFDFSKTKGRLWDIRNLSGDRILFRFENGIFLRQLNQQLETFNNETTVSIGSGTLFFPEPVELFNIDTGYIGTRSQYAFNSTPYGSFMVDDKRKSIYKFSESFENISRIKMRGYFNENLRLNLPDYFPEINPDNPNNSDGVGFISTFDSENKLWILTKKDYIPVQDKVNDLLYSEGKFYYRQIPDLTEVHLSDPEYFINKSWSMSFDAEGNIWESWHSFLPLWYIQSTDNYFSVDTDSIWKHNSGTVFNSYFGREYPFIVEFPIKNTKSLVTKLYTLYWKTFCYKPQSNNQLYEYRNITFDGGYIYNDIQCTGNLNFVVKDKNKPSQAITYPSTGINSTNVLISSDDQLWSLSYIWDKVQDAEDSIPFLTSSWDNTRYRSGYFIDQVVDNSAINYTKSWHQLKPLKSLWYKLRLIFNHSDLILSTHLNWNLKDSSIRKG